LIDKKDHLNLNKILYLPTRYFPSISGAEFYFQSMAEILTKSYGYNIDIFCSNAIDFKALRDSNGKTVKNNDKYFNAVNKLKINRFPIDYKLSLEGKLKKVKEIDAYKSLNLTDDCLKEILINGPYLGDLFNYFIEQEELDYDLIHTTFFPYFNIIMALMIGDFYSIPVIITPFYHFSNPRYKNTYTTEVLTKFNLIIACTNLERKFLINYLNIPEEIIKVISMGVDYEKFIINRKRNHKFNYSFKKNFIGEDKNKLILNCAYKNYEKGTISILKAIPYILEKMKNVTFVFIGPSTMAYNRELSRIQKITSAKIINLTPDNLTGYYDKKKISAFQEADLFIMPSRSDAFGIAYLEAWAAGKPVIGANIGATPEVIRENIDGLLVEFDNPKDIADKVIMLLKKKRLRKKFGLAGQQKVQKYYTWEIIANSTHKIYQNLINELE